MELILLTFVWDETASWTVRNNTENGLHSRFAACFLWDETASGKARSNIENGLSCLLSVLLLAVPEAFLSNTKTRSRSAVQSILNLALRSPRGCLGPIQK